MIKELYETDPEFMERFDHFAFHEVVKNLIDTETGTADYTNNFSSVTSTPSSSLEGQTYFAAFFTF